MADLTADIVQYRLPLRRPIAVNEAFLAERKGFILRLSTGDSYGYGDVAPLSGFSAESLAHAERELLSFCSEVNGGQRVDDPSFLQRFSLPSVAFGIESALWWLQQNQWLTPQLSAPLLQGDLHRILGRLKGWQGHWPMEFKVKTGRHSLDEDIDRIQQMLKVLPPSVKIKLDANRQWSFYQALAFVQRLSQRVDIERIAFIEEPTDSIEESVRLFTETGLRFALDESIQQPDFALQPMLGLTAIVIKPMLVGGLTRSLNLINEAEILGIRSIISSSYESSIGLHILQQWSARWTPDEPPGLDTATAFIEPLMTGRIRCKTAVKFNPNYCDCE